MTCAAILLLLPVSAARADQDASDRLRALARQFSEKVGDSLNKADHALAAPSASTIHDKRAKAAYEALPDNELLLLTASFSEARSPAQTRYKADEPITALKRGYSSYISFTDFNYLSGLSIKLDPESGKAEGWFLDEDRPFALDVPAGQVRIGDTVKPVAADDVIIENDDFYIRDSVMADWFDFTARVLPYAQSIDIVTNQQLPLQGRLDRLKRRGKPTGRPRVEQPRIAQEFKAITMPRADVNLRTQWEQRGDSNEPNNYSSYNILTTNQLLDHEMSGYFSGTPVSSREASAFTQARINFRKESEDNDLLGPLHAKVYEFNDIAPVTVVGTGGSAIERGVRVSNQGERYTVGTETTIEGDAQPGWDVELYRNNAYIAGTTVDETGRYNFENVPLFAGDNRFRIALFGPQGEQAEDSRIVTVLPSLVGNMKGYYDVSLTQKDEITYQANQADNEDRGSLRLVGSYDRRAGDNLTLRGGVHSRETQGQRDNYFYTGAVTSLGPTIINADMITTSDGPFKTTLTGRRTFGRHNATGGLEYVSADFSDSYIDDSTLRPQQQSVYATLNGPFMPERIASATYTAFSRATTDENGRFTTSNRFALGSSYAGLRFDNELRLGTDNQSTDRDQVIAYAGGVTGRYDGYLWRGRLDYEIAPLGEPSNFTFDVTKNYSEKLSGNAGIQHKFYNSLSQLNAGVTYRAEKARISPNVSYDSDQNLQARVDVNFGLARDPSGNIIMSGRPMSTQAGISVFSYLDKAGNGVFDGDDEPLQDVIIRATQANVELVTDAEGNASSATVPANRVTDIVMEESSAFEPTWVSGYEGASVLLRPTESVHLDFPVVRGAEMDGTASIAGATGAAAAARSVVLRLVTPDGEVVKSTATPFDGFFIIEQIRPGIYYLTTDSSGAPVNAYRMAEKIIVTPDGAQLYGHNIELTRGYNIPFTFSSTNRNPSLDRRVKILRDNDIAKEDVYVRLGNYRSRLAMTLAWYKLKLRTGGWANKLTPVEKDFYALSRDAKTGLLPLVLKTAQPLRLQDAARLCETLSDAGFKDCGVDVVTTYQESVPLTAADTVPNKG